MPINDLGYRNWDAKPTLRPAIWTVITKAVSYTHLTLPTTPYV